MKTTIKAIKAKLNRQQQVALDILVKYYSKELQANIDKYVKVYSSVEFNWSTNKREPIQKVEIKREFLQYLRSRF